MEVADRSERTPLLMACGRGMVEGAKMLIRAGVDVNPTDYRGYTPLMWAAKNGNLEVVRMLLDRRAKTTPVDTSYNRNALMIAAENGHYEVVKLLLEVMVKRRARIDRKDIYGWTAKEITKDQRIKELLKEALD